MKLQSAAWFGLSMAIVLMLVASCSVESARRDSTPSSQPALTLEQTVAMPPSAESTITPAQRSSSSIARPTTPGQRYSYLPAQTAMPVHRVGGTANLTWEGYPIQIALVGLAEPRAIPPGVPLGERSFLTTVVITNTSRSDLYLSPEQLFDGMNGSGSRLDEGGRVQLASAEVIHVPPAGSASTELLWHTPVHADDMRIWLTANVEIQNGGYVRSNGDGAVFSFILTEVTYPLGTPTPCAMAAGYVRETIMDNEVFAPGQSFEKTWVIENSGTCRWAEGSTWSHFAGSLLGVAEAVPLERAMMPGDMVTVTVSMVAPLESGVYREDWRLRAPSGDFYGRSFYVQIVVSDTLTAP